MTLPEAVTLRELIAKVAEFPALLATARAEERELCAKAADALAAEWASIKSPVQYVSDRADARIEAANQCAAAIRKGAAP